MSSVNSIPFISNSEPMYIAMVGGGAMGSTGGNSGGAGGYAIMQLAGNVQYQVTSISDVSYGNTLVLKDLSLNKNILSVGGGGIGKQSGFSPYITDVSFTYTCVSGGFIGQGINTIGGGGGGYYYMNNYRESLVSVTGVVGNTSQTNTISGQINIRPAGFGSGGGAVNFNLESSGGVGVLATSLFSGMSTVSSLPAIYTPAGSTGVDYYISNKGGYIIQYALNTFNPAYLNTCLAGSSTNTHTLQTPIGYDTLGRQYYFINAQSLGNQSTGVFTVNTNLGFPGATSSQVYANVWLFGLINSTICTSNGSFLIRDNPSPIYNINLTNSSPTITDRDNLILPVTLNNEARSYTTIATFIQSIYHTRYITWTTPNVSGVGILYFIDNASMSSSNPNYTPSTQIVLSTPHVYPYGPINPAAIISPSTYYIIATNVSFTLTTPRNLSVTAWVIGAGGSGGASAFTTNQAGTRYGFGGGGGGGGRIVSYTFSIGAGTHNGNVSGTDTTQNTDTTFTLASSTIVASRGYNGENATGMGSPVNAGGPGGSGQVGEGDSANLTSGSGGTGGWTSYGASYPGPTSGTSPNPSGGRVTAGGPNSNGIGMGAGLAGLPDIAGSGVGGGGAGGFTPEIVIGIPGLVWTNPYNGINGGVIIRLT